MKKKLILLTLLLILASLAYIYLSPSIDDSTVEPSSNTQGLYKGTLTVGHLVALDMAPLFLAKEKGYFSEEGISVETRFFANPGDNSAALASGSLQLTVNPFTLPYLGYAAGADMRFISSAGGVGVIEIVAQGSLNITTFGELIAASRNREKKIRIGSLKGDTLDVVVYKALQDRGSDYEDFEMVWFNDLLAMVQAFQSGDVDVLSHIKPYTTELIADYGAVSLGTNSDVWGLGTPNCVTMVMADFARKYPESLRRYLKAISKSYQYMIDNPSSAAKILTKGNYYKVSEEIIFEAISTLPGDVMLRPNMTGVKRAISDLVAQGYMKKIDKNIYDPSFLNAIGQDR